MEHKDKSTVEAWARHLLRQDGHLVEEDEPIGFWFIPDDQVGSLAIFTSTKRRREQAYVSIEDEGVVNALASLVEFARRS